MIKRISILGPGLLGGSIALAIEKVLSSSELVLWGRREQPLEVALQRGVRQVTTDLKVALDGVDLCILATPVGVMRGLVEQIAADPANRGLLLTDVGSVKRLPHEQIAPILAGTGIDYIGSHPMAGSEQAGMEAARVDLLKGAVCLITNDGGVSEERVRLLEDFWTSLGCITRRMSAEDHDYAVARVSHFPHVMASVSAMVGLSFEDIADLCGGGMRDTSRVAAGDPGLWTEILMENRDAVQRSLRESVADLTTLLQLFEVGDRERLYAYLDEAKRRRQLI